MKKFIAVPLLVLYLIAVSGTMVQFHFCGDQLSSLNINLPKASCCCSDDMAGPPKHKPGASVSNDDCCSNKVITLKIVQEQNTVYGNSVQPDALQVVLPPKYIFPVLTAMPVPATVVAYHANAPPGLWQGIPLYKLHSRFTYYG